MNNWIPNSTILTGQFVELRPLEIAHFDELTTTANDKRIWEFYPFDGTNPVRFEQFLSIGLADKAKGSQFPFVIFHKKEQKFIGSTRFLDIVAAHKKMEIGSTWLHPDYWATAVNLECKLLLLTFAFENLGAVRVQLRTDENNIRSRKAIEKIGGTFEGIFRNDIIRDNGTHRNSAYFSLIQQEWAEKKERLTALFEQKK